MTPLEQLEKRVLELEQASNLNAFESFMQVLVKDNPNVIDTDVTLTLSDSVPIGGGSVTFDVLDFPDKWLVLRYRGELYRVPAYLKKMDAAR